MEPTDFARKSLDLLAPLGLVLHRAMEPSIEDARTYLNGRRFDGYLFSDLTRYHTTCRIEDMKLPKEILYTRLRNNGIQLFCNGCLARVWKADEGGELHGPGYSKSKRAYFDQESLFPPEDPTQFRFGIVWDYDFATGLLKFSLACPKQFDIDRPWRNPDCHFYIAFPYAAGTFEASSAFTEPQPDEDDIELKPRKKVDEAGPNDDPDKE